MFTEDLSPFFDTADGFAVPVVFNGALTVNAIFDNAYVDAGGLGAFGTSPMLTAPTAALTGVVRGSTVVVNAVSYVVEELHPDGTGVSLIKLRRA